MREWGMKNGNGVGWDGENIVKVTGIGWGWAQREWGRLEWGCIFAF